MMNAGKIKAWDEDAAWSWLIREWMKWEAEEAKEAKEAEETERTE